MKYFVGALISLACIVYLVKTYGDYAAGEREVAQKREAFDASMQRTSEAWAAEEKREREAAEQKNRAEAMKMDGIPVKTH